MSVEILESVESGAPTATRSTVLEIEPLATWSIPVWSRGVVLDETTYCFADLKGSICLLDLASGSIEEVARHAPASADLVAVEVDGEPHAAIATHGGELVLADRGGKTHRLPPAGSKVRAGLRVIWTASGEPRVAVLDSRSRLSLVDPRTSKRARLAVELRHGPARTEYGVVAAPLFFADGGRNKLFLTGRSGVACQIDLRGGSVEWSDLLPYGVDSDPVRDPESGRIFFASGESLHGRTLGRLYCYDPAARCFAWSAALQGGADVMPLLTRWRDRAVVVTATLMDASLYVFDREDGRLLQRAEVPETPRCRHTDGRCTPVGYGNYHTQTAVCKFYAAPFAVTSESGETLALCAASHNGWLYRIEHDGLLHAQPLEGCVRASPARASADALIVHAGDRILRLRSPRGQMLVTSLDAQEQPTLEAAEFRQLRFAPRRMPLVARRLRGLLLRRLLGRKTE